MTCQRENETEEGSFNVFLECLCKQYSYRQRLGTSEWSMLWQFGVYLISVRETSKWISLLGIYVLDICVLISEVQGGVKYKDNFSYPVSSSEATCRLFKYYSDTEKTRKMKAERDLTCAEHLTL